MMTKTYAHSNVIKLYDYSASHSNASHNQRVEFLQRLILAGGDAATDCEILESILLMAALSGNVNSLAIRLLERFGTLNAVLWADAPLLEEINGVNKQVLRTFALQRQMIQRGIKSQLKTAPVIQSWSLLMDYCRSLCANANIEEFRVLYLNHRHQLIADERVQWGTVNHTPVYAREIVKRALKLSAAAMIIIHNHPSGDCTPSVSDIEITKTLVKAANAVGITIHDHVIVSSGGHYSFKSYGLMLDPPQKNNAGNTPEQQQEMFPAAAHPVELQYDLFMR